MSASSEDWNIVIKSNKDLGLCCGENWWHIEPANTDYWSVHSEHGRDLARNLIRYMRQHDDSHALGRVMRSIFNNGFKEHEISVFDGFIAQIGEIIAKNQTGEIPQ